MKKRFDIISTIYIAILIVIVAIYLFHEYIYKTSEYENGINSSIEQNTNIYSKQIIDRSLQIAKMYNWDDYIKGKKIVQKAITENEMKSVIAIIERAERFGGVICYLTGPNYIIVYNDQDKKIDFRLKGNAIEIEVYGDGLPEGTYDVYRESDVISLLNILDEDALLKLTKDEININKTYTPPNIYINYVQSIEPKEYVWKDVEGKIIHSDVLKSTPDYITKEMDPIECSYMSKIFIKNTNIETDNVLPSDTIITYYVYNNENLIFNKKAERLVDGSYYIELPNLRGEYSYMINMEFDKDKDLKATYYFKVKI